MRTPLLDLIERHERVERSRAHQASVAYLYREMYRPAPVVPRTNPLDAANYILKRVYQSRWRAIEFDALHQVGVDGPVVRCIDRRRSDVTKRVEDIRIGKAQLDARLHAHDTRALFDAVDAAVRQALSQLETPPEPLTPDEDSSGD